MQEGISALLKKAFLYRTDRLDIRAGLLTALAIIGKPYKAESIWNKITKILDQLSDLLGP